MRSRVADQQKQTANKEEPFLSEKKPTPVIRTSLQGGHVKFCPL